MDIEQLIKTLTLKQKVSLLSGKTFWETQNIDEHNIPSIFLSDGPHGLRKQVDKSDHLGLNKSHPATCFPTASALANSWDTHLLEKVGVALGKEAASLKVSVLLGPGTNIKRNPLCGRNFEYYSEDPYLAGKMASSLIRGVESQSVAACVKHFATNNQETKRNKIDSIVDERALQEIYLMPFEMAVKEGNVSSIMTSYNRLNGTYTNENHHLLRELLREKWGFQGVVVTDWGGENDRVLGLIEGNDLEMPSSSGETGADILDAIKQGTLDVKYVDEAVRRLLTLVEKAGPKEHPLPFNQDIHNDLAQEGSAQSAVLLENKGGILPLTHHPKVAIIGDFAKNPRYQGAGSSIVNPTSLVNTIDVISEYPINYVGYATGFDRYGKTKQSLVKKAVKISEKADVLLVYLGLDEHSEVEGIDRKNARLPQNQIELLNALLRLNKKIVVILSTGSYVELDFADKIDGLVLASLAGQAGARGILDILTGRVNPSGKLSETYALHYEDHATSDDYPSNIDNAVYKESIYVGYRYFDKVGLDVHYPFGYGLSYTSFEYSNLSVSNKGVTFTVRNSGKVDGYEISQLYVSKNISAFFRPIRELKGFVKTFLKAGEEKKVTIPFDGYTFRVFDQRADDFIIEKGKYELAVGSSSRSLPLVKSYEIEGISPESQDDKKLNIYFAPTAKSFTKNAFELIYGNSLPENKLAFINKKQNRILIDRSSLICELVYAKGWFGRFFARMIHFIIGVLGFFGKKQLAETMIMGVENMPIRGLSRMSSGMISKSQLEGLIIAFNGKFFKGIHTIFKEGRMKRHHQRYEKKQALLKHLEPRLAKYQRKPEDGAFKRFGKRIVRFFLIHEGWWQFLKFFLLSNLVTFLQIASKLILDPVLASTPLAQQTFQWIQIGIRPNANGTPFYIFDYPGVAIGNYMGLGSNVIQGIGGGLALFLSYYIGVALAQVVNFFLQRNVTFKSKGNPWYQAAWYLLAFVAITFLSQAVLGLVGAPAYILFIDWFGDSLGKTVYDLIISGLLIPTISFWVYFPIFKIIFPAEKKVMDNKL